MDTKRPVLPDTQTAPTAQGSPVDEVPSLEALLVSETKEEAAPPRAPRGFAAMDPALVREIARRGARASHEKGTAHKFTADEARAAGRKGGSAPHRVRGRGKRTATRPGA
jgi:general stress protein YciG